MDAPSGWISTRATKVRINCLRSSQLNASKPSRTREPNVSMRDTMECISNALAIRASSCAMSLLVLAMRDRTRSLRVVSSDSVSAPASYASTNR